jgi:hypothetical protein
MNEHSDTDIRENLSAYLDGELNDDQARHVEELLDGNDALRTELGELRRTRRLLGQLPRRCAPEDFVQRVLCEAERKRLMTVDEPARTTTARNGWVRYAASAAVVLIVASVAILVTSNLWNPASFYVDDPGETAAATPNTRSDLNARSDTEPAAPEALGWAPQVVVISADLDDTSATVERALNDAGFVAVADVSDSPETQTNAPLYEWVSSDGERRELAVYYENSRQRQVVEEKLADIRHRQTVAQATRPARAVPLHVRRESLAGRDVARFSRPSAEPDAALGPFLQEHWAHLELPLGPPYDHEELTAFNDGAFRERTPEQEASKLLRESLDELRKEHGLSDSPSALEDDGRDRRRLDRIVRDSLAELHRRPLPASRPATNAATSADMKLMLISVISDAEARRLTETAD